CTANDDRGTRANLERTSRSANRSAQSGNAPGKRAVDVNAHGRPVKCECTMAPLVQWHCTASINPATTIIIGTTSYASEEKREVASRYATAWTSGTSNAELVTDI